MGNSEFENDVLQGSQFTDVFQICYNYFDGPAKDAAINYREKI